jgi:hypothetical protein
MRESARSRARVVGIFGGFLGGSVAWRTKLLAGCEAFGGLWFVRWMRAGESTECMH